MNERFVIVGAHTIKDLMNDEYLQIKQGCDLLNQQDQRIAQLEEQLKNAIVLPIQLGNKCWTINCWCEYGDANKGEPYVVTRYELHENIVSRYSLFNSMVNGKLDLNITPYAKDNYKGVQPYLFATKEEAQAKLEKLKGEKK